MLRVQFATTQMNPEGTCINKSENAVRPLLHVESKTETKSQTDGKRDGACGHQKWRTENLRRAVKGQTFPVTRQRRPGNETDKMTDTQEICQERKLRALITRKKFSLLYFLNYIYLRRWMFAEPIVIISQYVSIRPSGSTP